jgi:FkbM family methyltransferase
VSGKAEEYRRDEWFGARKRLKSLLGLRPFNDAARLVLGAVGGGERCERFPVNLPEVEGRIDEERFVLLEPMRCSIARELYWGGGRRLRARERFALDLFCRLARKAGTILDIGANTGIFSLAAAAVNPSAEIHAFEIVPEVYELLYRNFARNDILDRAYAHHFGLGRDGASIRLPETRGAGSLPMSFSSRWDGAEGRKIAFRSLDSLLPLLERRPRPWLAKIDVEGTEDDVLRHGEKLILAREPDLLCEVLPGEAKTDFLEDFLAHYGYALYKIKDAGLEKSARLTPDRNFHDWLFTKKAEKEVEALSRDASSGAS